MRVASGSRAFLTAGVDPIQASGSEGLPRGRGVLGVLIATRAR